MCDNHSWLANNFPDEIPHQVSKYLGVIINRRAIGQTKP